MRAISIGLGILSICGPTAAGQQYAPKVGVGMAFIIASPAGQLTGSSTIFVPLKLGTHVRLEPQIGWRTSSLRQVASDPTSSSNNVTVSSRVLLLGVGLLATGRPADGATILYYGPRVGLAWTHDKLADPTGGSVEETQTSWFVNAVVGGEHLFSHVSIGGEVGLGYLHFGTPNWTQTPGFNIADYQGHSLGTSATAMVRWYFGKG